MADPSAMRRITSDRWVTLEIPLSGSIGAALRNAPDLTAPAGIAMPTPPLFQRCLNLVQPLNGSAAGVRSASQVQAVLLPEELAGIVSPIEPVQVELNPEQSTDLGDAYAVFPVAYDDEFFYIVGPAVKTDDLPSHVRGRNAFTLQITRLPDLSGAPVSAARERINIWRAIKIGFFKLIGVPSADVGLRLPDLANDEVSYRTVENGELAGEGRVALLVHGFLSETAWMVQGLLSSLRRAGYRHVLTFDYETFTTSIRETVDGLARELNRVGIVAGSKRVDIVAHSMGSLVTRSLIAQATPPQVIRRALLMGAPNAGTPIAGVGDLATDLASLYLNAHFAGLAWGPVSPGAVVRFLWKHVEKGMLDLQPTSEFVRWVNDHPRNQEVPLTLLVGNASGSNLGNAFERLFHQASDVFYGGANDLVVPVDSMKAVTAPPFPSVMTKEVASNHFDYLVPGKPARDIVEQWIKTS